MDLLSTLESPATRRALASIDAEQASREASERFIATEFMAAAKRGDMAAVAQFAPLTTDWVARRAGDKTAKRSQTVGEVLVDSVAETPMEHQVMGLLCAAAKGDDVQLSAQMLLTLMGNAYAKQNAEARA